MNQRGQDWRLRGLHTAEKARQEGNWVWVKEKAVCGGRKGSGFEREKVVWRWHLDVSSKERGTAENDPNF